MDEYETNDMSNKMSMLMLLEYFNKRTATCAHFSKTKSMRPLANCGDYKDIYEIIR